VDAGHLPNNQQEQTNGKKQEDQLGFGHAAG
jgi:hypothetical protein